MATSAEYALNKMFNPQTIAVVGASANPKNLGSRNLRLINAYGFAGGLYAINPKGEASSGVRGVQKLTDIHEPVDLCIIAIPAAAVIETIGECVKKEIPVAQILTGGFSETGKAGRISEKNILEKAGGITRLVGPNCLGVFSAGSRITFVSGVSDAVGKVSIASQSGGLSADMLLQAKARGLELNKLVSIGNCVDIDPVDYLNYFGQDPDTEVVGLYIEGLRQGRQFYAALKNICRQKPVVILKGGRTSQGAKSVASHTNSLAGEYEIWKAAANQAGAILVEDIDHFLALLTALQPHVPRLRQKGIALVGNGGGTSVLATDLLEECGLTLASLTEQTKSALATIEMPPGTTVGNPTDTPVNALNKSGGEILAEVCNCLLGDSEVGGMIFHINLLPFINYDNRQDIVKGVANALKLIKIKDKPLFVSLRSIPEADMEAMRKEILKTLQKVGIPCFHSPSEAVKTLTSVYQWKQRPVSTERLKGSAGSDDQIEKAKKNVQKLKEEGCSLLPQEKAFDLLNCFGISYPAYKLAGTAAEAVAFAKEIGFPVALKIDSPQIIHKTDAGGVRTGLATREAIEKAFEEIWDSAARYAPAAAINGIIVQKMSEKPVVEMICGLKTDPVFGKVVLLGIGGILVELLKDFSMKILPLGNHDAGQMWHALKSSKLLTGFRGNKSGDIHALEDLIRKVALLGESVPEISELDLNPVMLMAAGKGLTVVDSRIILK